MSTLAGWYGSHLEGDHALRRMAEVLSGPTPLVESHRASDFAVTAVRPAVASGGSYIAATPEGDVVVAFSGYLHSEEPAVQRNPAPYCLELYQAHGPAFAHELNGSFAIVVRDRRSGHLLLITDRIGTRSLYYSCQQDFVFGSEVKAVLQYPGISRKPNPDRLREFLVIACLPGWVTYYDHILQVPAASVLTWDGETAQISRYWEPQFEWDARSDIRELATNAVQTMYGAVRRSCIGGERPGLMLSGGLDSRTIAATSERPLQCLTMHREDCYEVRVARQVARALGYDHRFSQLSAAYPLELLESGALLGDGMHIYSNAQSLAVQGALQEMGIDRALHGWSMDVHFSGLCLPPRVLAKVAGNDLPLPLLEPAGDIDLAASFVNTHRVGPDHALDALLDGCSAADALAAAGLRVQGVVDALPPTVSNKYDAVDWLELFGNTSKQADYLSVSAVDWVVPVAVPAHDTEMLQGYLRTPPAYRFNQRIYLEMYRLIDKRVRGIDYTSLGGPLSQSVWWNWARKWSGKIQRGGVVPAVRRLAHLPPAEYAGPWPEAGPPMRRLQEWRNALSARADGSRLAALGVVSGDGARRLIAEHQDQEGNHFQLLGAWLTLEAWLETYG